MLSHFALVASLGASSAFAAVAPLPANGAMKAVAGPIQTVTKTPALGWNSWNAYACNINEAKVLAAANSMVSLGLKAAGYSYVNIDDCWSNKARDSSGKITPDATKFPNGISGVATQVHNLGLKLGIYSDAGTSTCAGYPGSLGHETTDVQTWASWGVDYLKYDNCNVPSNWTDASSYTDWYTSNTALRYRQMLSALTASTRPIFYSLCNWGQANVWTWGGRVGHSWRLTGDATASWSFITSAINTAVAHASYNTFYAFGDMDMMEIGNGALTIQEQRTHFGAWIMMKSPIILGTDLSKLSSDQVAILKNPELLAFHQDQTVAASATPYTTGSPPEFYSGKSSKGTHVFVINTGSATANKVITFSAVPGLGTGNFKVHDMWTGKDIGTFSGSYTVSLASHDFAAFLVTKV